MNPLVYKMFKLRVGKINLVFHFFALTLPVPLQVGHFLYPVLPPVLRVRVVVVLVYVALAIYGHLALSVGNSHAIVRGFGSICFCGCNFLELAFIP